MKRKNAKIFGIKGGKKIKIRLKKAPNSYSCFHSHGKKNSNKEKKSKFKIEKKKKKL